MEIRERRFEKNFAYFRIAGRYDYTEARGIFRKMNLESRNNKLDRILIDGRDLTGRMSFLDKVQSGLNIRNLGLDGLHIMFLGSSSFIKGDRYFENVAAGLGLDINVTTDKSEAFAKLGVSDPGIDKG